MTLLHAARMLFDDTNTDKNFHVLPTAGADRAKRMSELSVTIWDMSQQN